MCACPPLLEEQTPPPAKEFKFAAAPNAVQVVRRNEAHQDSAALEPLDQLIFPECSRSDARAVSKACVLVESQPVTHALIQVVDDGQQAWIAFSVRIAVAKETNIFQRASTSRYAI
jgi:hypothetical protein